LKAHGAEALMKTNKRHTKARRNKSKKH